MSFEPIQSSFDPKRINLKTKSAKDLRRQENLNKMLKRPVSMPGEYKISKKVSKPAKDFWQTLNLLSNPRRESWWRQEELAELIGVSTRSIGRYIAKLIKAGWLRVEKKGKSRVNLYILINPEGYVDPREKSARKKSIAMENDRKNPP